MSLTRRSFVHTSLAAACGVVSRPIAGWGAVTKRVFSFSDAEQAVLDFVQPYAQQVRLLGPSVLLKLRHRAASSAAFLVSAADPAALQAALSRPLPFTSVRAVANTLSCTLGSTEVTIENVLPETFTARTAAMAKPAGNAFGYDALSYDPVTQQLADPFSIAGAALGTLVNPTFTGPQAVDVVLRGLAERQLLGLGTHPALAQWQARIANYAIPSAMASAVSGVFLRQLATLAAAAPASMVANVLRWRTVSSALKQTFGTDTATLPAAFARARMAFKTAPDAALWLALLLGPELESNPIDGAATSWTEGGTVFQVLRSRAALAQAQVLAQDPAFPKV